MTARPVAVTGVGLALPAVRGLDDLADLTAESAAAMPVDPAERIGKRGLRYKDRATQLALCAAFDALTDAGVIEPDGTLAVDGERVCVVASSNLGNLDTVCRVAGTIAAHGVSETSPMDLPNASSNVIASWIAIRFNLRGPNLMVCNGATSGLDAVYWAATMLAAGRGDHALVVGVETSNEVVEQLTGTGGGELLDGAAALVLSTGGTGTVRVGGYARTSDLARCVDVVAGERPPGFGAWYVPAGYRGTAPRSWLDGVARADVTDRFGRCSGALGVLQCAAAVGAMHGGDARPTLVTAGDGTGLGDDKACAGMVLLP
jgi:3-oxoacyl-[acyl-carrier-protein] synthase II